jgi:hypothetical protein
MKTWDAEDVSINRCINIKIDTYMLICVWQEKDPMNNWRRIFPALYPWKSSSSLSGIPDFITMTEH